MSDHGEKQNDEILVIDDEPSVAGALKLILEDNGYCVSIALTGCDGIAQARQKQFCLTITDLCLPDMTGLDVINSICRHQRQSIFILITAEGSDEIFVEARNCGAAAVLLKPFRPSEILHLIESALTLSPPADAEVYPSSTNR